MEIRFSNNKCADLNKKVTDFLQVWNLVSFNLGLESSSSYFKKRHLKSKYGHVRDDVLIMIKPAFLSEHGLIAGRTTEVFWLY